MKKRYLQDMISLYRPRMWQVAELTGLSVTEKDLQDPLEMRRCIRSISVVLVSAF